MTINEILFLEELNFLMREIKSFSGAFQELLSSDYFQSVVFFDITNLT